MFKARKLPFRGEGQRVGGELPLAEVVDVHLCWCFGGVWGFGSVGLVVCGVVGWVGVGVLGVSRAFCLSQTNTSIHPLRTLRASGPNASTTMHASASEWNDPGGASSRRSCPGAAVWYVRAEISAKA